MAQLPFEIRKEIEGFAPGNPSLFSMDELIGRILELGLDPRRILLDSIHREERMLELRSSIAWDIWSILHSSDLTWIIWNWAISGDSTIVPVIGIEIHGYPCESDYLTNMPGREELDDSILKDVDRLSNAFKDSNLLLTVESDESFKYGFIILIDNAHLIANQVREIAKYMDI